jgi:hypothetical protein
MVVDREGSGIVLGIFQCRESMEGSGMALDRARNQN